MNSRFLLRAGGRLAAASVFLTAIAGCGSGSGGTGSTLPVSSPGPGFITRQNDGAYSSDAKILASRAATGPLLSTADAARFDADLAVIRAAAPAVQNIHASATASLNDLLVTLTPSAPFRAVWQAGTVIPAGDPGLDTFLNQYAAITVQALDATGTIFKVTFGQSVNPSTLATVFKASSANLASVSVDSVIGISDQITANAALADGSRPYTFTEGWGDCSAGCVFRHTWQFRVSADGKSATLTQESGTPLPTAP